MRISDWSSDVCSSDLLKARQEQTQALDTEHKTLAAGIAQWRACHPELDDASLAALLDLDEQSVGQLRQQLLNSEKAIEQARVLLTEREQRLQNHQAQHNGNLESEQQSERAWCRERVGGYG